MLLCMVYDDGVQKTPCHNHADTFKHPKVSLKNLPIDSRKWNVAKGRKMQSKKKSFFSSMLLIYKV